MARREPQQSRSKDTVTVLLEAAERILRESGPEALTTKRVAAVAGVGVGTLYQYFPSKEAIITALEKRMWSRTVEVLRETLARVSEEGRSFEETIHAVVLATIQQIWPGTSLHGWTVTEQLEVPVRDDVTELTKMAIEMIAVVLQNRGAEVHPKNARLAAALAIHTVTNLTRIAVRDYPDLVRSGEFAPEVARMVSRYLLADEKISD